MIESVIRWSVNSRILVLLSAIAGIAGVWAVKNTPVDAIDLSMSGVVVNYPGQSPQVVEDRVTPSPLRCQCLAHRRCENCHSSAMPTCILSLMTIQTCTGLEAVFWNT